MPPVTTGTHRWWPLPGQLLLLLLLQTQALGLIPPPLLFRLMPRRILHRRLPCWLAAGGQSLRVSTTSVEPERTPLRQVRPVLSPFLAPHLCSQARCTTTSGRLPSTSTEYPWAPPTSTTPPSSISRSEERR